MTTQTNHNLYSQKKWEEKTKMKTQTQTDGKTSYGKVGGLSKNDIDESSSSVLRLAKAMIDDELNSRKAEERYIILKHTWNHAMPFPVEVALHIDKKNNTYWMELNGCQETARVTFPNSGIDEIEEQRQNLNFEEVD